MGSQADNLFYLDPHNARPAIPLRPPGDDADARERREMGALSDWEREQDSALPRQHQYRKQLPQRRPSFANNSQRVPASPSSTRTASSTFSHHAPISPSPLQHQFSSTTGSSSADTNPSSDVFSHSNGGDGDSAPNDSMRRGLDPIQLHYCTAYSAAELKTFHCDRVRKMPLSGLDPSMLIGFLCRDEKDWWDFKKRVTDVCLLLSLSSSFLQYPWTKIADLMSSLQLPRTIFSVQDELPTWPSDSDDSIGLESISEPDDMDLDDEVNNDDHDAAVDVDDNEAEEEEEEEGEVVELDVEGAAGEEEVDSENFFDTCSGSASTSNTSDASIRHRHRRLKSDDVDTEEDPVDPVTPGPKSRFDIVVPSSRKGGREEEKDADEYHGFEDDEDDGSGDDIEDDWIDPSVPSPTPTSRPAPPRPLPKPLQQPLPPPVPMKDHEPHSISSSSSSSQPVLASKSKSSSSKQSSSTLNNSVKVKKSKKQVPVPVPQVRLLAQQQPQEHYPFPVAPVDDPSVSSSPHRVASQDRGGGSASNGQGKHNNPTTEIAVTTTEKRMHTARARDGGRTQSGGVKGILPES